MDYRDVAGHYSPVLHNVNQRRMTGTFTDDNEIEHTLRLRFEICGTCDGRGAHVNPGIDSHGLSSDDFADDPDFLEDYMRGTYDVSCNECRGARVVPVVDEAANPPELVAAYHAREQEAWDTARDITRERDLGY